VAPLIHALVVTMLVKFVISARLKFPRLSAIYAILLKLLRKVASIAMSNLATVTVKHVKFGLRLKYSIVMVAEFVV
jgi:hypothetical protein